LEKPATMQNKSSGPIGSTKSEEGVQEGINVSHEAKPY
jgi:hypothetical protein